jgi:hypothetical protein
MTVEAGNIYALFLDHYFQIFCRSDVPPGLTGDGDPVLKRFVRLGERQRSSSAGETAFDFRDALDSAAIAVILVLDQRAVFKARLSDFVYHEMSPYLRSLCRYEKVEQASKKTKVECTSSRRVGTHISPHRSTPTPLQPDARV